LLARVSHGGSLHWRRKLGRTFLIGQLSPFPRHAAFNIAFYEDLRRSGFIEGKNLTIHYRDYGLHGDLISQYATDLVNARVDVIVTGGEPGIGALQKATKTIPIVALGGDLLGSGFVKSLSRPDGNTTGVSILAFEADGKRQDILIEAVPGLRLMAVLTDGNDTSAAKLDVLQKAARARDVGLLIHRVANSEEIAAAIDSAQASGAKALNILASPLFYFYRQLIMDRVAALHLPTIYEFAETAEEGGFAAYGPTPCSAQFRSTIPTGGQTLPWDQGRRHPRRTAHQVRADDQPQDR